MSRRNLTSNKRSFRKNPRSFIDRITDAPIDILINDGVNPEYTVRVDPKTASIKNPDSIPAGVSLTPSRPPNPVEEIYEP